MQIEDNNFNITHDMSAKTFTLLALLAAISTYCYELDDSNIKMICLLFCLCLS